MQDTDRSSAFILDHVHRTEEQHKAPVIDSMRNDQIVPQRQHFIHAYLIFFQLL